MDSITSRHNPVFKSFVAAKNDKAMVMLEGRRLVNDALLRGMNPRMAASNPAYISAFGPPPFPCTVFAERLFSQIADTVTPQGIVAFFDTPWEDFSMIAGCEKIIVLDALQDPGNVGTIIRTAEAFGFQAVIITPGTASPFSPKAVRSSMGSCLGMKIARACASDLRKLPHKIISLAPRGDTALSADLFTGEVAICLGREGEGLGRDILGVSHYCICIPMRGPTESLNVAVAAGIILAYASGVCRA